MHFKVRNAFQNAYNYIFSRKIKIEKKKKKKKKMRAYST